MRVIFQSLPIWGQQTVLGTVDGPLGNLDGGMHEYRPESCNAHCGRHGRRAATCAGT